MIFWIVRYINDFYQFNSPPDLNEFPYYSFINEMVAEEYINPEDALSLRCDGGYYSTSCPAFLKLDNLPNKGIRKISVLTVCDDVIDFDLKDNLKSWNPKIQQELYKKLITLTGESCTANATYFSSKNSILKELPIQDLACFIGNSKQEYIEALSRYLPTSVVDIICKQKLHTISDVVNMIKRLSSREIENLISMLPIDKVSILKRAIDNKANYNFEEKTSLIDKLKNNKLI